MHEHFGIMQADRLMHTYLIGKTGTGKSTLLKNMILQDIHHDRGVCLLDPHGDLVEEIHNNVPERRKKDIIYFNIPDSNLNLRYNPLRRVSYEKRALVASSIIEAFKKLWSDAWGVKLEHFLRSCIITLLDQPKADLEGINKLLLDRTYRNQAIQHVVNPSIQRFWKKEFPRYNRFDFLPVLNKVSGILSYPVIKRVLIENENEIYMRQAMDQGKIVLVNLAKGHLGQDASHIIGALFVSSMSSAAFSRVTIPEETRRPFHVFLDEFHNFTTKSLIDLFAELRKFRVSMTISHQYLGQLDDKVRQSIIGNVGTSIIFRLGTEDARFFAREFCPYFHLEDIISLPNYQIYLRLMVEGRQSKPFSGRTIGDTHVSDHYRADLD